MRKKIDIPRTGGIYKITNVINGKIYIGSTSNLKERYKDHLNLNGKKHSNLILQKAIKKYGRENFTWEILEFVLPDKLIEREQHYLDTLKPFIDENRGYNIAKVAGNNTGIKHSNAFKEMRRRIANEQAKNPEWIAGQKQTSLELWQDPEYIAKMMATRQSPEYKEKQRVKTKENWQNPEIAEKQLKATIRGRNTPEAKDKQRKQMLVEARRRWDDPLYKSKMDKIHGSKEFSDKMRKVAIEREQRKRISRSDT